MKRLLTILVSIVFILPLRADNLKIEISEDGQEKVTITDDGHESILTETNDLVPYGNQPDWSCDLRMQVGGLAVGDLDSDGDPDLAVGCYKSQSYPPYNDWRNFILYNIGGELQTTPIWWSQDSSSTTEICIGDLNYDGFPDVFSANGDASFAPSRIYFFGANDSIETQAGWISTDNTWTTGAALCDFDRDGDLDAATSNQGLYPDSYRPVHIFVNRDGILETYPSWSSSTAEISGYVAWGDYNNDGWDDLAVSKWANFYSCVYRNNSGTMMPAPAWIANNDDTQKGVGWSDINGDDYPELAIGGNGLPTELYPNNNGVLGVLPIWYSANSHHGCQDLAWADVDGDGDEDLATVHFSNGHLRIYLNVNGQLDQTPSWQYDAPASGTAVTFGDINGDGAVDLIMGVSGEPCVMAFYNMPTAIEDKSNTPESYSLLKNYPNPFNGSTAISFQLDKSSSVKLDLYNLLGEKITSLADGFHATGKYNVTWDGLDGNGKAAPSGVYFCRLETETNILTNKMILLR
jgi:hypothetical protein